MMSRVLCVFSLVVITSSSPVAKVLELLTGLETKIKKDAEQEDKSFAEYEDFCKGSAQDKGFAIKTATAEIEDLTATINKADADASAEASKVEELGSSVAASSADLKAAAEIRANESAEFQKVEAELMDTVDTLDRAINVLQRNLKGSALLQTKVNMQNLPQFAKALTAVVDAAALSLRDKKRLMALTQNDAGASLSDGEDEDAADLGAPAAEVYSTKSESIVDVLEDLREKAQTSLAEARKEEVNQKHNHDMLKQSLEDQIAADKKEMSASKSMLSSAKEAKASAEGDLAVTKKDLADTQAALEELQGGCLTAATDHENSVKSRTEELEAIAGAIKAVKEMSVSGAEDIVYTQYKNETSVSFLQMRAISKGSSHLATHVDLANFEVVNRIKQLAKKERSAALAQLATRLAAVIKYGSSSGEDPFAKVKAMITDMIGKLQQEASAEASHKEYCDKETAASQAHIDELTTSIDGFKSKVDKMKATSVALKGDVETLNAELADIVKTQATMDKLRGDEKTAFVSAKADLEQGLEGVRLALKMLREYYASEAPDGDAASFMEQPSTPNYHVKDTASSSGIIGMLEVIESDCGKSLAQAELNEDTAETEYQKLTQTNKITKATKEADVKYKTKEAASLDKAVLELVSDMDSAQSELDAVLEYSKTIRSACVAKPTTYEERKQRREAEIAGLREALEILGAEGGGAALLQGVRHGGLRGIAVKKHK